MLIVDNKQIIAQPGFVFRRKADGKVLGRVVNLGYVYSIGGVELDKPHKVIPSDFEEVYEATFQGQKVMMIYSDYGSMVEYLIGLKYTYGQESSIQRQRDRKPEEFKEYDEYCEACKEFVKSEMARLEAAEGKF